MREEDSNWFSKWEEELPSPEELIPLSQSLITPDLAVAFDLQTHNHNNSSQPSLPPQQPPPPSSAGEESARTLKRQRLVWTPQLHKRFVDAVTHLGIQNAVPKTIMQLMSVDGLTRENVASHLQKYRLYLTRISGCGVHGGGGGVHGGGGGVHGGGGGVHGGGGGVHGGGGGVHGGGGGIHGVGGGVHGGGGDVHGGGQDGGGGGGRNVLGGSDYHLFSSSHVPTHFFNPTRRQSSDIYKTSFVSSPTRHHRQQQPPHAEKFTSPASNGKLMDQSLFLVRQSQHHEQVFRTEDFESRTKKALTLFPTKEV